jgi:glucosylceramidase
MDKNFVKVYLTSKDSEDRITIMKDGAFTAESGKERKNIINVYSDIEYQKFMGFGGAFTESAADTFYKMQPEKQTEILKAYFDKDSGNGYTFCRTHMNSCDFSINNYSCDDMADDVTLEHFNIERDLKQLIPMIKAAMKFGEFKLFLSPWSPPSWMKSNGRMNEGGKLLARYKKVWADFYAKFIKSYSAEGIKFWGLTVQNEPMATQTWDSCVYSANEEVDFVKNYLSPSLISNGLNDIKIMIWDHNKDKLYDRVKTAFSDPEASKLIWGAGFHWYSGDHFEAIEAVHKKWPDKNLVFTEGCKENGPSFGEWDVGERYAHEIIGDLNNYTCAWCDWNLFLDMEGGPNHVSNFCDAPLIADAEHNHVIYEASYWYIGHFSRFIKPNSVRICYTKSTDKLELTAFKNDDKLIALVVMNKNDFSQDFTLRYKDNVCDLQIPQHSILTCVFDE